MFARMAKISAAAYLGCGIVSSALFIRDFGIKSRGAAAMATVSLVAWPLVGFKHGQERGVFVGSNVTIGAFESPHDRRTVLTFMGHKHCVALVSTTGSFEEDPDVQFDYKALRVLYCNHELEASIAPAVEVVESSHSVTCLHRGVIFPNVYAFTLQKELAKGWSKSLGVGVQRKSFP